MSVDLKTIDPDDIRKCPCCGNLFALWDNALKIDFGRLPSGVIHTDEPMRMTCPNCGETNNAKDFCE